MRQEIEINSILKNFYNISGIRISIHDSEFNEIYSYPDEASCFCKTLQNNASVLADCRNNDKKAFQAVKKNGKVYVYKCHCGLYEAVAPLYHFGVLSGYLMMGQIRDNKDGSLEYIIKKSADILKSDEKAKEIAQTVKVINSDLISSYISIMTVLAEYITSENKLFSYSDQLPQLIMDYIRKNLSSKITLSILSQKFGCCNSTLAKCFKKEYGISIMGYICKLRLEKSKEMLCKTRKSLKEISFECGFYDQNYFSKTFAKAYGCSPSEYRTKNYKSNT
ncbi:MAG: PocR ligand-binding domain-containing protein [Clostridia bacterium]|nr:PocR ligand-binding domain-containing protein [Clostridia bacterium]